MAEKLDVTEVDIPTKPVREWIWTRVLVHLSYVPLRPLTSLQWVVLSVLDQLEELQTNTQEVAQRLGVSPVVVEEGLNLLVSQGALKLRPRHETTDLGGYQWQDGVRNVFQKYQAIPQEHREQKFVLFRDPDTGDYRYQTVAHAKNNTGDQELAEDQLDFNPVLRAAVNQIWHDLGENPTKLVGEVSLTWSGKSQELLSSHQYTVADVRVNFL